MRNLFIIIFCLVVVKEGTAQNSFGLEFGTYFHSYQGINDFDSIRVVVNDSDRGEMFGGLFYEIDIVDRVSLHNKFTIRPIYISNTVYNNSEQCQFCSVKKVTLSPVTNLSIEIMPQFELLKLGELKVRIFGGLNTSFNFRIDQPEISFNGRHPGVALVMNSLDNVVKPVSFSLIYGASAEYRRFIVWAKNQHQSVYSKKIEISGQSYNFKNSWQFLSFSIGYRFYSLKLNQKTR
ncbi:MAG TPA: hypothetical protein DDY13_16620 [Cytophagales bacterium]|jgi:hypothetical protein|nr:hypothetical protein [Cytophagales bacterium]